MVVSFSESDEENMIGELRKAKSGSIALLITTLLLFSATARAEHGLSLLPGEKAAELPKAQIIYYQSHGLKLKGLVYKPDGPGPFPAFLWNHGSERYPIPDKKLGHFWIEHRVVFFKPFRSGHAGNPGIYSEDLQKTLTGLSRTASFRYKVRLQERANDDVISAYRWLSGQSYVDPRRISIGGGSYGGIQTLLAAERDAQEKLGVRCFVAMSPASASWSPLWAQRLSRAVSVSRAPIFLMQACNDYSLGPSRVLGPLIHAKGLPNRQKVFPVHILPGANPSDHAQGHGQFFKDANAWQDDVLSFFHNCGEL